MNIKKLKHNELKLLISGCYEVNLPLFVFGRTGIGKSYLIRQTAIELAEKFNLSFNDNDFDKINENTFSFIDVRLSQLDISDIKGLPLPNKEKERTEWLLPDFLPRCEKSRGILFLDELNLAPPSIQATAYQLILDRRIGNYKLPDGWLVISAGNLIEDKANIFEIPAPLSNRFLNVELATPTAEEWINNYALKNNIDERIIAFLTFRNELLFKFSAEDKAFPTPRSWTFASKMIKNEEDINKIEIYVASCVGEATAIEFVSWLELTRKVNIDKIIENPLKAEIPNDISMVYAICYCLFEKYKTNKKLLQPIVKFATRLEPEFSILLLKLMKNHDTKYFINEIIRLPEWKNDLAKKLSEFILSE